MKKVLFVMLASMFVFGALTLAACGDDDDDAIDNVAACQELEDSMNALECLAVDFDYSCDAYSEYTACDYAEYFDCLADVYSCDGDTLVTDMDKLTECGDIATDIAGTC
ncbi:MAG TPA: hypothetical protein VM285_10080 [Polyangia bacterium]|nr:hypothetical protein [Polyangia bacterium]